MIDYLFENRPRYLLVDEIDKMSSKDHDNFAKDQYQLTPHCKLAAVVVRNN